MVEFGSFRSILISGIGFFSDAYDLFIINIVMTIIESQLKQEKEKNGGVGEEWEKSYSGFVSTGALIGAIIGQITFGFIADKIGRKWGFVLTLSVVCFGAVASAFSPPIPATYKVVYALTLFRFILGIGIGGEYPLSAAITAENSEDDNRGRMIASVFSMQGIGAATAAIVGMVLLRISTKLDLVWRLCLGLGAIPGILTMYFRVTMAETALFEQQKKTQPSLRESIVRYKSAVRTYWKELLGAAGGWFLLDVTFYSNGLFSTQLLKTFEVGEPGVKTDDHQLLIDTATFNVYLALMAVPGYWLAVYLVEHKWFGRRNTQLAGFFALGLNYLVIAIGYKDLEETPWLFLILYGMTFFFTNAGANTTTFILPSELFPTRYRASLHGICAASGKLGAAVGAYAISLLVNQPTTIFYVCTGIAWLGFLLTYFTIPETRGKSLAEMDRQEEERATILRAGESSH